MKRCYHCNYEFDFHFKAFRNSLCPSCSRDVKVCKNCEFYSPEKQHGCSESVQETITDKERANFCDFFRFNDNSAATSDKKEDTASKAKDKFDSLFS